MDIIGWKKTSFVRPWTDILVALRRPAVNVRGHMKQSERRHFSVLGRNGETSTDRHPLTSMDVDGQRKTSLVRPWTKLSDVFTTTSYRLSTRGTDVIAPSMDDSRGRDLSVQFCRSLDVLGQKKTSCSRPVTATCDVLCTSTYGRIGYVHRRQPWTRFERPNLSVHGRKYAVKDVVFLSQDGHI